MSWTPPGAGWVAPDRPAEGAVVDEAAPVLGGEARPVGAEPPTPQVLRPTGPAGIYDGAFEVLKTRPRVLLAIAATVVVPTQLLAMWGRGGPYPADVLGWIVLAGEPESTLATAFEERPAAVWATGALEVLATFLVGVAVATVVGAWYAGRDPGPREVLRAVARRPGPLVVAFVGMALAKVVGVLVLCVGLLLPLAWYAPLAPALAIENLGGGAALKRSFQLANRRVASVVGIVVGMALVDQVLRLSLQAIPWVLADSLPDAATTAVRCVLVLGVSTVSSVFIGAASTLLYLDLRVRTEGLDLELEATDAFAVPD